MNELIDILALPATTSRIAYWPFIVTKGHAGIEVGGLVPLGFNTNGIVYARSWCIEAFACIAAGRAVWRIDALHVFGTGIVGFVIAGNRFERLQGHAEAQSRA